MKDQQNNPSLSAQVYNNYRESSFAPRIVTTSRVGMRAAHVITPLVYMPTVIPVVVPMHWHEASTQKHK